MNTVSFYLITVLVVLLVVAVIRRGMFFNRFPRLPRGLVIGLDGSGKTLLLNTLKNDNKRDPFPTMGFNAVTVDLSRRKSVILWDLRGVQEIRSVWRCYYSQDSCSFLVFVIDGSEPARFEKAREELLRLDEEPDIPENVPCVILCNKKDLPDYISSNEVGEALEITDLKKKLGDN
ncbi:hypothetical protein GEMRC1_012397 [Eukaryota sp. GEM-RC1]